MLFLVKNYFSNKIKIKNVENKTNIFYFCLRLFYVFFILKSPKKEVCHAHVVVSYKHE